MSPERPMSESLESPEEVELDLNPELAEEATLGDIKFLSKAVPEVLSEGARTEFMLRMGHILEAFVKGMSLTSERDPSPTYAFKHLNNISDNCPLPDVAREELSKLLRWLNWVLKDKYALPDKMSPDETIAALRNLIESHKQNKQLEQ